MKAKLKFIAGNFVYLILAFLAYRSSAIISFWFNGIEYRGLPLPIGTYISVHCSGSKVCPDLAGTSYYPSYALIFILLNIVFWFALIKLLAKIISKAVLVKFKNPE